MDLSFCLVLPWGWWLVVVEVAISWVRLWVVGWVCWLLGFGLNGFWCFGFEMFWCFGVCWVLFSMSFSAWLLRKCKKRNKKSNSNVSNFSFLRSVSLSLKPVVSLSLRSMSLSQRLVLHSFFYSNKCLSFSGSLSRWISLFLPHPSMVVVVGGCESGGQLGPVVSCGVDLLIAWFWSQWVLVFWIWDVLVFWSSLGFVLNEF